MTKRPKLLTEYPVDEAAMEKMRQAQKDLQFASTVADENELRRARLTRLVRRDRRACLDKRLARNPPTET